MSNNELNEKLKLLIELYNRGKFQDVLSKGNTIKSKFPRSLIIYNILGASNTGLKKYSDAINCYNEALKIDNSHPDTYNNIGVAYQKKGDQQMAIKNFEKAIKLKSDYPEAYNNLGISFKKIRKYKDSLDNYSKALLIKSNFYEAYFNLGAVLYELGDYEKSLKNYQKAIIIKPDYHEAYYNMCAVLPNITFSEYHPHHYKFIEKLLDYNTYVRPQQISNCVVSLLKFDPEITLVFDELSLGKLDTLNLKIIEKLGKITLLNKMMKVCRIADISFENLFTKIRSSILFSISKVSENTNFQNLQLALALQCFHNEYIFNQTEDENRALEKLIKSVEISFEKGTHPSLKSILCIASYRALYTFKWSNLLDLPLYYKELIKRQILDFRNEKNIKSKIKKVGVISDKISKKVQAQYEENPYPRWTQLRLNIYPLSIKEFVEEYELNIKNTNILKVYRPEVLIAGCGTGQNSISTATKFRNCKILATDISLSSLAYAIRKTDELGIKNIEYVQSDILNLNKIDKKFDIIECSGVLHHMDNPIKGWQTLFECLKTGGLMKIALYSSFARSHINKIREEISNHGIQSTDDEMKNFRIILKNSDKTEHRKITNSQDFYSLSTFRDLIFHEKEHQFNLLEIKSSLEKLGLIFSGFENKKILKDFKTKYKYSGDQYDLHKWNDFEKNNPDIFIGMYQFWCQKLN